MTSTINHEGDRSMSTKKSNTPRKSATNRNQKSRTELRRQLARDITSILKNPECPVDLFNDVAEAVCDWSSDLGDEFYHSPEMIERSLNARLTREEKRKGGAR
jgi:hypothetical protein